MTWWGWGLIALLAGWLGYRWGLARGTAADLDRLLKAREVKGYRVTEAKPPRIRNGRWEP